MTVTISNDTGFTFPQSSTLYYPVVERQLCGLSKSGEQMPIDSHKGLYRAHPDTREPVLLGVVKKDYKVLNNIELFRALETRMIRDLPHELLTGVKVRDSQAFGGAKAYREYVFPNFTKPVGARGEVCFRVIISNGFDGLTSVGLATGFIDFYCTNGLIIGDMIESTKFRHSKGLNAERVVNRIADAYYQAPKYVEWLNSLAQHKVDIDKLDEALKERFADRTANKLLTQVRHEAASRGGLHGWAVVSALTYYSSHPEDPEFALRETGNDHAAHTMLQRERQVGRIVRDREFFERIAA